MKLAKFGKNSVTLNRIMNFTDRQSGVILKENKYGDPLAAIKADGTVSFLSALFTSDDTK